MKDPSIVRYGDKWHLFCTVRGPTRSHAIVYLSFRGCDEKLEADPANLRFLFQGVLDKGRQRKPYGAIPWKLGLLEGAQ